MLLLAAHSLAGDVVPQMKEFRAPETVGEEQRLGLPLGSMVNEIHLLGTRGEHVPLLGEDASVLIIFYKGGWCPFCNGQLRDLALHHDEFVDRGIRLVAVSTDTAEASAVTKATWTLPFTVLSDPEARAVEVFEVGAYLSVVTRMMLKASAGIDPSAWRDRNDHQTSLPAVFLVQEGVVTWKHVESALNVRPSAEQLLAALPLPITEEL